MYNRRKLEIIVQLNTNTCLLHLLLCNTVFVQKSQSLSDQNIATAHLDKRMMTKQTTNYI